MRFRNENLPTGSMLTYFNPYDHSRNRSILFLVSGPEDIRTLTAIEEVCQPFLDSQGTSGGFSWFAIPDQRDLGWIDPHLDVGDIVRLEACEFKDLPNNDLMMLLHPVMDRIRTGEKELFPCAGGAAGGPAEGIQFLDRDEETKEVGRLIVEGKNILLLAPRRSGKTSMILRLCKNLEKDYFCHFINLERFDSPEQFAARLLVVAFGGGFRAALNAVKKEGNSWEMVLKDSLETIKKQSHKPIVLFMDELVLFFENFKDHYSEETETKNKISTLLNFLSETFTRLSIRFLVAGSMDLFDYLDTEIGIGVEAIPGLFSELKSFHLKSLSPEHSDIELRRLLLGTGIVLEGNDALWLKENLDLAVPYPALNFLDRLSSTLRHNGDGFSGKELDSELSRFVAITDAFKDFDSHLQGFQKKIQKGTEAAEEALSLLAEAPFMQGVSVDKVKQRLTSTLAEAKDADTLLSLLCSTFPLEVRDDRLFFASRLFYRWWKHQIEQGG